MARWIRMKKQTPEQGQSVKFRTLGLPDQVKVGKFMGTERDPYLCVRPRRVGPKKVEGLEDYASVLFWMPV